MKVKKHHLLFFACIVWMIAGFNVLKIGIESYNEYRTILNYGLTILVFGVFWFMVFYKLTVKHTTRIQGYEEEKQFFYKFFDLKSFFIMAFMISFGIIIRTFHLLPERFIAVFYTGLGAALFLAGVLFGVNYFTVLKRKGKEEPISMKKIMNTSLIYFVLAMAGGVFYREFTKWNGYTEPTTLGVLHVHLLVMGTVLFLLIALFAKVTDLEKNSLFKKFFVLYNVALPFMVVMMLIRGIVQVLAIDLGKMGNGMLSGFAGLSHITMMVSLLMLLIALKKEMVKG